MIADLKQQETEAVAWLAQCEAKLEKRKDELKEERAELEKRKAELKEREAKLEKREAELKEEQAELKKREAELKEREAELKEREAEFKKKLANVVAIVANAEANLATAIKRREELEKTSAAAIELMLDLKTKFFTPSYHGEGHVQLIKYAKAYLEAFQKNSNIFFAAFIAFVQSSGYGKTRTLMEVASQEPTLYICARRAGSSGFPPRNKLACAFLKLDPSEWFKYTFDPNKEFKLRLLILYKLVLMHKSDMCGEEEKKMQFEGEFGTFWLAASNEYARLVPETKDAGAAVDAALAALTTDLANKAFVMLAIDEASTLAHLSFPDGRTVFRALRAAMRDLQLMKIQMVLVLTDTFSSVSTFLPSSSFDNSQRPDPEKAEKDVRGLFPPFVLRTTLDALREARGFGRLLVAEYAQNSTFLLTKLAGTDRLGEISTEGMLALMLVRVAANISPPSRVSERVAASHMATMLAASYDREALLVTYVSEPPLAAAASLHWDEHLCELLSVLREALTNGAVAAGWAGEIAAQIICLVAFDSQSKGISRLGKYISLEAFLGALLPKDAETKGMNFIPAHHSDATLSVLQFVQLPKDYDVTEDDLKELYLRSTAAVLPPGQAGADLLIPYKYGKDEYSFILMR